MTLHGKMASNDNSMNMASLLLCGHRFCVRVFTALSAPVSSERGVLQGSIIYVTSIAVAINDIASSIQFSLA